MSRSGYSDDGDDLALWRGRVASAIRGKRGQKLLLDLVRGLDAMPEKKLIEGELQCADGMCALGVVGHVRGVELSHLNPSVIGDDERSTLEAASLLDVAECLAQEVTFLNDEGGPWRGDTPENRWQRMRDWAVKNLKPVDVVDIGST